MSQTVEPARAGSWRTLSPSFRLRLLGLAVALGAMAAWGGVRFTPASDILPQGLVAVALLALHLVAESTQLHLEVRRQTYSISLSELPLVVGLFLAEPLLLLGTRLAAYSAVAVVRRMAPDKAAFNVAVFAAEIGVALAVFQAVGAGDPLTPAAWRGALLASLAAVTVSCIAVGLAIRLIQPPLARDEFAAMVLFTLVTAALCAILGLLVVILLQTTPLSLFGLAVCGILLALAYRRFSRLLVEHKDLGQLYELTREVSTSLRAAGLDEAVLERVRRLMRAEVAQLWLAEGGRLTARSADGEPVHLRAPTDAVRERVLRGASVLAGPRSREPQLRAALADRGARELVAVPLRVQGEVVGSLEVLDRQGERSRFVAGDRALLETLAVHTGVALENVRLVARLRHEAEHDPLTGLPNRKALLERLDQTLEALPEQQVAVIILDLQAFKDVNDTLGRAAGDRLLIEVGQRVRAAAEDPDAVARLSSDEIGVFLPGPDRAAPYEAAASLRAVLATPVLLGGAEIEVSAVAGIALARADGADAVTLLQRADIAMYAAKATSHGALAYSPTLDVPSVQRFSLVADLRRALDGGDLVVWYQPQVRLQGSELVGLEALVRWQHPEDGLIPPDAFLPVAEHTGLIGPLTSFVLGQALADLREWHRRGHRFGVSVNISVRSLLDPGFADEVGAALRRHGIPPSMLTLEITETSVMSEPARAVPVLDALRTMGIRLSVDDFGIGQSSLTYLRRLPVAEVKIDRSFVAKIAEEASDLAIVRAVIDMSRPLGLSVVAEGVETEEIRGELARLGCEVIQGYLLSRPLPRPGVEAWLSQRTVCVPAVDPSGPDGSTSGRWLRVVVT